MSLISHPSKVMLKIIPNRFKPQAENISAEEQAGFRAGQITTITNFRFADDIDGLAGEKEELAKLVECLDKASTFKYLG